MYKCLPSSKCDKNVSADSRLPKHAPLFWARCDFRAPVLADHTKCVPVMLRGYPNNKLYFKFLNMAVHFLFQND